MDNMLNHPNMDNKNVPPHPALTTIQKSRRK
jgi:hypothetical protein